VPPRVLPTRRFMRMAPALIAGLVVGLLSGDSAAAFQTRRVVLLVIDGPRATEFLEDPTHANIPRIWRELRPQGFLSHSFYNLGATWTDSGHASILSGTWQTLPDDGSTRPTMPTLWEYYRRATGAPDSSVGFATLKQKLLCMSFSSHLEYGWPDSALAIGPTTDDESVVAAWKEMAERNSPVLSGIFLGETDRVAHSCNWPAYLDALRDVDSLAADVWSWIESTPDWAGRTAFFITADHGRHTAVWCNHGDDCPGCRQIPLIALGPDIVRGVESWTPAADQRDVCRTVATLLDFPVPYAEGRLLWEMLAVPEAVSSGVNPLRLDVRPQPSAGPIVVALPEAGGAEAWIASLHDLSGRVVWRRSCTGVELLGGLLVPPPGEGSSGVAWLRVRRADGASATSRLVWVR
jgi:hypothetical protein